MFLSKKRLALAPKTTPTPFGQIVLLPVSVWCNKILLDSPGAVRLWLADPNQRVAHTEPHSCSQGPWQDSNETGENRTSALWTECWMDQKKPLTGIQLKSSITIQLNHMSDLTVTNVSTHTIAGIVPSCYRTHLRADSRNKCTEKFKVPNKRGEVAAGVRRDLSQLTLICVFNAWKANKLAQKIFSNPDSLTDKAEGQNKNRTHQRQKPSLPDCAASVLAPAQGPGIFHPWLE